MQSQFSFLLMISCIFNVYGGSSRQTFNSSIQENNRIIEEANKCFCVLFYQCDSTGYIIVDGKGIIDVRFGGETDKNEEKRTNNIICQGGNTEGEYICCKSKPATPATFKLRKQLLCGEPRPNINVRILPSDELTPLAGEFPWLAAIYRKDSYTRSWNIHKAGSLIHPKVVLTGAHVVGRSTPQDLKVIVNSQTELDNIGSNPLQERDVHIIIKHGNFSSGTGYNNVALLILETAYNISAFSDINTICLRPDLSYLNKKCLVAGWSGNGPKVLQKVELPTHPSNKCQDMLRRTRLGPQYLFHESFMCAGGEKGKDACTGDGGSPLVCPTGINDTMFQVGIVTFGIGCGMENVPGIYADVGYFYPWIKERLNEYDIII